MAVVEDPRASAKTRRAATPGSGATSARRGEGWDRLHRAGEAPQREPGARIWGRSPSQIPIGTWGGREPDPPEKALRRRVARLAAPTGVDPPQTSAPPPPPPPPSPRPAPALERRGPPARRRAAPVAPSAPHLSRRGPIPLAFRGGG